MQTRQSLVFLRAPKHFNIGKHKVFSFKNFYKKFYNLNLFFYLFFYLNNNKLLYNIITEFHKFHLLYKISSMKITIKVKIQFVI